MLRLPFTRKRDIAPALIDAAAAAVAPQVLAVPEPFASQLQTSEVFRLSLAGESFSVGLRWMPESVDAGRARSVVQRAVRSARRRRGSPLRLPFSRKRGAERGETAAGAEAAAGGVLPVPVDQMPDDLYVVRDATLVGASFEQAGLAQSGRGHVAGDWSLAALLAERVDRSNTTFFLTVGDGATASAYYFCVIQNGLVRASTDRCFTRERDALDYLHRWLRTLQRQSDQAFRLIVSPGVDIPGHDAERLHLSDLLEGVYPPTLIPVFFSLSKRARKRLALTVVIGGLAVTGAAFAYTWWSDYSAALDAERRRISLLRSAERTVQSIRLDPVSLAPWELRSAEPPSTMMERFVARYHALPVSSVSPSGLGAYALGLVDIDVDATLATYVSLLDEPRVAPGMAPPWPVSFDREFPIKVPVARVGTGAGWLGFAAVDLQPVADAVVDPAYSEAALRSALVAVVMSLEGRMQAVAGAEVRVLHSEFGQPERSTDIAWAVQYFSLDLPLPVEAGPSLGALLDSVPSLQLARFALGGDDRLVWRLEGYVAGALGLLARTRHIQSRADAGLVDLLPD